jgi:hypothetical protein
MLKMLLHKNNQLGLLKLIQKLIERDLGASRQELFAKETAG